MPKFVDAEREFGLALQSARQMDSRLLETRIMTNIASVQFLRGSLRKADATANAGIATAVGAAAEWKPFLLGVRSQIAFARGDSTAAAHMIERTFAGVDLATSIMPFRDFHATAYQIYETRGDFAKALAHLRAFKRLDDDGRDVAASANAALNGARFDAANQDLRISELKAERIEGELRLARSHNRLRGLVQFGSLIAAAAQPSLPRSCSRCGRRGAVAKRWPPPTPCSATSRTMTC